MTNQIEMKDKELLQARLASRLAALLGEQGNALPHDITERLRVSREHALLRARAARRHVESASNVVALPGGLAVFGGPPAWWLRMANLLPLLVLVAGLLLVDQWTTREQILAAADIDTVLLSDDLPPDAYADPGFAEFLKAPPP